MLAAAGWAAVILPATAPQKPGPSPCPACPRQSPWACPLAAQAAGLSGPCSVLSRRSSTWPLASICCSEATEDSCDMVLPESRLGALPYIAAWLTYEGPAPSLQLLLQSGPLHADARLLGC